MKDIPTLHTIISTFLINVYFEEVEEVMLMQYLTVLLCIVYGCSIADGNSEVSESASEVNQFWPYSA